MYEVVWQEFNRSGALVTKRKAFDTEEKMQKYVERLVEKDNFYTIVATR